MDAGNNEYFTTLELTQRLDLIRHLIDNMEVVPLVRGPSGIGKSCFAERLRQLSPPNWSICLFEANPSMVPDRLLNNLARCFDWTDLPQDLLDGLTSCFEMMRNEGQVPVLLIDEAQQLPTSSLITLLRLFERHREGEPLVSIVLLADQQIDQLLAMPQLQIMAKDSLKIIDLPMLSREDATRYMYFLFKQEDLSPEIELNDLMLTRLYRESKGIPGPLGQAILDQISTGGKMPMVRMTAQTRRLFFGIVGLSMLVALLMFQDQINQFFEVSPIPHSIQSTTVPEEPLLELPNAMVIGRDEPSSDEHSDPVSVTTAISTISEDGGGGGLSATVEQEDTLESQNQAAFQVGETDATETLEVERHAASMLQPLDGAKDVQPQLESGLSARTQDTELPVLPIQPPGNTEPVVDPTPEPALSSPKSEPAAATVTHSSKTRNDKPILSVDSLKREDWIRSRPTSHFTLQLLGVEHVQSLKEFVARHGLQNQAFYYVTERKGKSWYPLLWGDFPNKKSAIEGARQLPLEVQSNGYWVRKFGDVQSQLSNN